MFVRGLRTPKSSCSGGDLDTMPKHLSHQAQSQPALTTLPLILLPRELPTLPVPPDLDFPPRRTARPLTSCTRAPRPVTLTPLQRRQHRLPLKRVGHPHSYSRVIQQMPPGVPTPCQPHVPLLILRQHSDAVHAFPELDRAEGAPVNVIWAAVSIVNLSFGT